MSSQITYPTSFDALLGSKPKIRGEIDSTIALVGEVLSVSKLPFFTDYTNHGVSHLNGVLGIADQLISATARKVFSPEDAAVLTLSVLLHDLALHLSESGFASLVNKRFDENWSAQWEQFLNEARHWDDRTLVALFGEDENCAPRSLVKDPFDHYDNLTESDRKLIGEFIRRNHPQLARYFAERGFPGVKGEVIEFTAFEKERRKLAGIVAWSHGTSLRRAVEVLKSEQFSPVEFDRVHPVFLMGLLRLSDFLELGADRAPRIVFRYTDLKSPISQREWKTNQAFRSVSWGNPDPESITIPARPEDIVSFTELQKWLNAIQAELDTTWAVFGETFSSNPHFTQLGLTIRRVRSNILDNLEGFREKSTFAPRRASLDVAGPQILKLFIEPLYGNHPEVGIRELIQNAVDAVRERKEWEAKVGTPKTSTAENDVEVWLGDPDEKGVADLIVADRGIGMTEDTVVNYFLTVGASFRRSMAWKVQFENEAATGQPNKFKSKILRSGRFGIGVLSGFLLGDEISVSTRHVSSDRGIRFSIRLDLPPPGYELSPIQLDYDRDLPVGTTISLKVTRVKKQDSSEKRGIETSNIFSESRRWDWYCLAEPKVARFFGKEKKLLTQDYVLPSENALLPPNWYSAQSKDYSTVLVLASGDHKTYAPGLTCNGFKIVDLFEGLFFGPRQDGTVRNWQGELFPWEGLLKVSSPQFSIFDPDGNLPLNLQRTGLTNLDLDFIESAFEIQAKSNLASLLEHVPTETPFDRDFLFRVWRLFQSNELFPLVFTKSGVAPTTPSNFRMLGLKKCLLVNFEAFREGWLNAIYPRYDGVFTTLWGNNGSSPAYSIRKFEGWMQSARVITRSSKAIEIGKPRFKYKTHSANGVSIYRSADCKPSLFEFEELKPLFDMPKTGKDGEFLRSFDDFIAAEIFLKDDWTFAPAPTLSIGRLWEQIIRQPVIPYDLAVRTKELAHAYSDLAPFIASVRAKVEKS